MATDFPQTGVARRDLIKGAGGGWVFNAATIWRAQGLAVPPGHMPPISHYGRPHGPDPRIERITRNVLDRFIET